MIGYKPVGLWECGCTTEDYTLPAKLVKLIDDTKKAAKKSKQPLCYYYGISTRK